MRWASLLWCILLVGCASEVPVELNFSSANPFLWSSQGRVVVFADAPCAVALDQVVNGTVSEQDALFDTGLIPVCELQAGRINFTPLPNQPATYVGVTFDPDGVPMAAGCEEDKDARSEPRVLVTMGPTRDFSSCCGHVAAPCGTIEAKCGGACDM